MKKAPGAIISVVSQLVAIFVATPALSQEYDTMAPPTKGQVVKDQSGGSFMEEETPAKPPTQVRPKPYVDLSNVGVPVDDRGRIIPTIDRSNGPVRQTGSVMQVYNEPIYTPIPSYAPIAPMPYPGYIPYQSSGINLNFGRKFGITLGANNGPFGYPGAFGSPFGLGAPVAPFGSPYGYGAPVAPFGTPFGYRPPFGYGNTIGYGNPLGTPLGGYGNLYGNPYGFGNPYGVNGFNGFNGQPGGLGLGLFIPPKVQYQSTSTYTPMNFNLSTPP